LFDDFVFDVKLAITIEKTDFHLIKTRLGEEFKGYGL
tara:strand:- start:885 stop:995 length:111 start_codon:yes stop_codon:yes gene_type:complete